MSFFFFYSQSSQIWSAPRVSWWCRGRRRSRRCGRHLQRWRTNTLNHKYSTKYCGDAGLVSFWYCVCCRWSCRMPGKILRAEEVEDLLRSSVTSRNYGATAWLRMYILYAKQSPVRHFVKMFFFLPELTTRFIQTHRPGVLYTFWCDPCYWKFFLIIIEVKLFSFNTLSGVCRCVWVKRLCECVFFCHMVWTVVQKTESELWQANVTYAYLHFNLGASRSVTGVERRRFLLPCRASSPDISQRLRWSRFWEDLFELSISSCLSVLCWYF